MAAGEGKILFRLGDIAEELGVERHVLRFWEQQFPQVRPMKIGPRKKLYRREDLEVFREIKRLLYEERFSVAGAQKKLAGRDHGGLFEGEPEVARLRALLGEARSELAAIKAMLAKK